MNSTACPVQAEWDSAPGPAAKSGTGVSLLAALLSDEKLAPVATHGWVSLSATERQVVELARRGQNNP
jgi:hypothetical protein